MPATFECVRQECQFFNDSVAGKPQVVFSNGQAIEMHFGGPEKVAQFCEEMMADFMDPSQPLKRHGYFPDGFTFEKCPFYQIRDDVERQKESE